MRRIDLFCKLMGPLTISLVAIASIEIAIYTTIAMNAASVFVEYVFIEQVTLPTLRQKDISRTLTFGNAQVYRRVRGLERVHESTITPEEIERDSRGMDSPGLTSRLCAQPRNILKSTLDNILPVKSLQLYYKHPAFLASFALALLYFTVLSFSGQMITYLISVGYTSYHVGIARVGSSIFEISATWAAPYLMKKIGIVRAGIWSLAWQMACLAGALGWYLSDFDGLGTNSLFSATGLAIGVALSRIGLWGYDLSAQNIIQDVSWLLQRHWSCHLYLNADKS